MTSELDQGTERGAPSEGLAIAEARRSAGLTERALAQRLGISLWEVERIERGEVDPVGLIPEIERQTGRTIEYSAPVEPAGAGPDPEAQAQPALSARLDGEGILVLASITALVVIRFFTETIDVLPRVLNFIDIPIVFVLAVAAMLSRKPSPPLDRFARSLLPITCGLLFLCAVATLANTSRVAPAPALVFVYGVLSPLAIYRSVLRLWPSGCALAASRLLVGLGVIQLAVATMVDLPKFAAENNPDVISGTFGTNPYQFVVFMLLFVSLLAVIYSFEPERISARLAPFLIGGALVFMVLAQYRALLITIGLSLLLVALVLSIRRGGQRGLVVGGVAVLAFTAALAFGAQKVPILKLHQTFQQSPTAVVKKRLDIASQVGKLYQEDPRYILTGTGPGTYSSRGWQTFALSGSTSQSNVQGGYALSLTGGKEYTTDVSDEFVRPLLSVTGAGAVVAGSLAANSPYSDYASVAAEVGLLGLFLLLAIYVSGFLGLLRRVRRSVRDARPGDPLPALLVVAAIGFFVLLQMAALDNWMEVTRLTFPIFAIAAIAVKEFDTRPQTDTA